RRIPLRDPVTRRRAANRVHPRSIRRQQLGLVRLRQRDDALQLIGGRLLRLLPARLGCLLRRRRRWSRCNGRIVVFIIEQGQPFERGVLPLATARRLGRLFFGRRGRRRRLCFGGDCFLRRVRCDGRIRYVLATCCPILRLARPEVLMRFARRFYSRFPRLGLRVRDCVCVRLDQASVIDREGDVQ